MAGQVLGAPNQDPNDLNEDQEFSPIQDNQTRPVGDISNNPTTGPSVNFLRNSEKNPGFRFNKDGDSAGGSSPGATDSTSGRSESPASLKKSEESSGTGEKEEPGSRGFIKNNFDKYNSAKTKSRSLRSRVSKNKFFVGIGVGGGGVFMIILILVLIGGAYKLVDFGEHIAAYQFARTASLGDEATTNIDNEALSLDTIPLDETGSSLLQTLQAKYTAVGGQAAELWAKFDNYRPTQVIKNFGEQNQMNFVTSETSTGREYISSVKFSTPAGEVVGDFETSDGSFTTALKNHLIPGYKFYNDVQLSRDLAPQLTDSLKGGDIGIITRSRVASLIREKLDVGLVAWLTGKALGPSNKPGEPAPSPQDQANAGVDEIAEGVAEGESVAQIAQNGGVATIPSAVSAPNTPGTVSSAESTAVKEEQKDISTTSGALAASADATSGNASSDADAVISSTISSGGFLGFIKQILGIADPVYKFATPICLIWDGSIVNSGPTMDSNAAQTERTGLLVQSADAQLKDGYTATGEIDGAWNNKLGNIDDSYAEEAASGQPFDTSNYQSAEASPIGQYSTNLADYLGSGIGGILGSVGSDVCPTLTSLWTAAGVSLATLALSAPKLITGFGGLTDALADSSMSDVVKAIGSKVRSSSTNIVGFGKDVVKTGLLVGGATLIAKQLVYQESGVTHSGLATDTPYDNDAFCGTNIYANQIDQEQYYGAPLVDQELESDSANSQTQLAAANSSTGAFNRYFALSNPDSLLSHLALEANSISSTSSIGSFIHLGATYISDPGGSLTSLLRPLLGVGFAKAPVTSVNTYCGNVQFGYTAAEKALLDECPSDTHDPRLCTYQPLENQLILDESGEESAIATTYGKCFDGSESIGDMLANGDIVRYQSGDIVPNAGLCSPDDLGLDNTDSEGNSPCGYQGCGDLVFRYRVANMYNNTLDQLTCEQTSTPCEPSTGTTSD